MEAIRLCREFRVALPRELLYADDLVVIAETKDDLIKRLNEWRGGVGSRGVGVSVDKAKVVVSGERQRRVQGAVGWPCGVCGGGVGSNSMQCISCQKWVHKKSSGIKGSMVKVIVIYL